MSAKPINLTTPPKTSSQMIRKPLCCAVMDYVSEWACKVVVDCFSKCGEPEEGRKRHHIMGKQRHW